ncbi:MAG: V-type ATP synthase subunit K [Clostridia bacterium]|jgi:V/A-type H+-transporting ATPase subunit K|nr:V-type ATP synthase subunit K [Clostridia bacterium]MBQ2385521.1 V-type ATP synthase subunit K [Clostridia bacterium]MBQ5634391.1 V-type ATP synthase subunit K [Clostridia bacterium]MBR0454294.1 V-type ATP synthase subunit K [Clostridia bacterium]MBR2849881.1 V-type ATP synthase subunit K [Clostridia bacterium]
MTFSELLSLIFTGNNIAFAGAALAATLACMGSAKAVGLVGEASAGLVSEDPSKFGKALLLQALPATQGIYGFITAFLILFKMGVFSGSVSTLTIAQGAYFFVAALPIAVVGYVSAVKQGKVSVAGVSLLSKRPKEVGKAMTSAAMVEAFAIFALLVSLLMILFS